MKPEWVMCNVPWSEFKHTQCRAGMVLKVRNAHNNTLSAWLVGCINEQGGVCDDCSAFNREDIVVAYMDLGIDVEDLAGLKGAREED